MVAYDPKKSRTWKATAQDHMVAAMAGAPPLLGALSCEIAATFTCPASEHRKTIPQPRRWHAKKPDSENVAKAVLDAATGVLWLDDSQVSRLVVVKAIGAQGEPPRLWLKVEQIVELRP
jgi:Holliday junction resolvase RusA-like endonuclease